MDTKDTLEQFEDGLQRELGWRRKELIALLLIARSSTGDAQGCAIRSGIVLIYAHLEGFVRQGARRYFVLVKKSGLPYRQLALNFLSLKISKLASQNSNKTSYYHKAAELLVEHLDQKAVLPKPEVITARSNLTFEQFEEILYCINVDSGAFVTRRNFMDTILLEKRNAIAHGEYRLIGLKEYEELHTGVLDIIDKYFEALVNAAAAQSYCSARDNTKRRSTGPSENSLSAATLETTD